jgi:hypothetical protein
MKNKPEITTKKLVMLLASRFLLQTSSVSDVLRDFRRSLVLYISSAMFIVSAILVVFFEVHREMVLGGFSYATSLNIIILALALFSLLCFFLAKFFAKRAKNKKKLDNVMNKELSLGLEKVMQSFLDGLFED